MTKRILLLCLALTMTACGTSKPAARMVPLTGAQWGVSAGNGADPNFVNILSTLAPTACPSGVPPIGWYAGPPACLSGSDFLPTDTATPQSLLIAVPSNPLPYPAYDPSASDPTGGYFYFSYVQNGENIVGNGQFWSNGNVTGTWSCTEEMPCSGMTGSFSAGYTKP